SISGSFTAAPVAPTGGYLVVQRTSSTLSSNPVDGATYAAGNSLGGGTVCAVNSPTTYTFSSNGTLGSNTQYYFFVIPFNKTAGTCSEGYGNSYALTNSSFTCPGLPTALNTGTITATTAVITWTAPTGGASSYDLQWKLTSGATWTTITGVTSGYTLNPPLSASTSYDVQVRANNAVCSSAWTATKTVVTSCASISTFPWTENFDALGSIGSGIVPTCWLNVTGTKAWSSMNAASTTHNAPRSTPNYMTIAFSNTTASQLWTPMFQLTGGTAYTFSFYYTTNGITSSDIGFTGTVIENTSQSLTGASTLGTFITATQGTTVYTQYTVNFTPGTSGSYCFGLNVSSTSAPWYLGVDDFSLSLGLSPCSPPTSAPTNLGFNSQSATSISGSFTAAPVAPTGGYLVVQSTSSTLSFNPVDGTLYTAGTSLGGGTVCAVNTPSTYTFSSNGTLTSNTQYYFFVIPFNKTAGSCSEAYGNSYSLTNSTYTCPDLPTALNTGTITATTAVMTWTAPAGGASSYDLRWQTTTGGSWTTITGVTSGYTLNPPLSGSTSYDVQVRATNSVCSSAWTATKTVVTSCVAISTFPWSEGFESMATVGSNILPNCWSYTNITSTNSSYNSTNGHTGTHYIGGSWSFDVWDFTPGFTLTGGTSYDFSYWFREADALNGYTVTTTYGTSQSVAAMTNVLSTETVTSSATYVQRRFTFTPATSGTYYFGIHNSCPTSTPNGIWFDDFGLDLTPACATAPSALSTSLITSSSARISWTAPSPAPGSGYEVYYSTSSTAPTTGTSPSQSIAAGTTYADLSGLSSSSTYYVWVRCNCNGTDKGTWTALPSFNTACGVVTSFFQNFDGVTAPAYPNCWREVTSTTYAYPTTSYYNSSPNGLYMWY
ncbi:MAG: fibronectin type III domain-containing protein, partial [Bacteroidota bacterium]